MANFPQHPFIDSARRHIPIEVHLGGEDGEPGGILDDVDFLIPLEINRSLGGRQLDYVTFAYDLGRTGQRLQDMLTPTEWKRQVDVRAKFGPGFWNARPLAWGELTRQSLGIDNAGEAAGVVARIEPYHFGQPLEGMRVMREPLDVPQGDYKVVTIEEDIVFNPEIDGVICPNMEEIVDPDTGAWEMWVDPESVRTAKAREVRVVEPAEWTLAHAIDAICNACNPDGRFISNPQTLDSNSVELEEETARQTVPKPLFEDAPPLRNVRLKRGLYLPDYLDALLPPHGYDWFIGYRLVEPLVSDHGHLEIWPHIAIIKRGDGRKRDIFLQAPGEELDVRYCQAEQADVETSVADLANRIIGSGSLEQREVTIELVRGWPEEHDSFNASDLIRTDPDSDFHKHQHAWRLWVGNEAGDYCQTRPEIGHEPLDLSPLFTRLVARRRRVDDCLHYDMNVESDDGGSSIRSGTMRRRPPLIEWNNGEDGWQEVPSDWGAVVLEDQIGVYFTGDWPPEDLVVAGDDAKVRITGTITGDMRVRAVAEPRNSSPNGRDVTLHLDLSDRFHDRRVVRAGDFQSVLAWALFDEEDIRAPADEKTDALALQQFCEDVRDIEDSALMHASFTLHGLQFEYQLGDVLTRINNRQIWLDRNALEAEQPRFLQITQLVYQLQAQKTLIVAEPIDIELDVFRSRR